MKDVDTFNKLCSKFDCDMDLISGKYYVNAKSIMGIFSLDLEMPLELVADMDDEKIVDNVFKEFLV
nr:HPr family phosphocarrier protein [uncultured Blautia sp.]